MGPTLCVCVGGAQSGPFVKGKTPAHILISAGSQSGPSIVRDEECSTGKADLGTQQHRFWAGSLAPVETRLMPSRAQWENSKPRTIHRMKGIPRGP